MSCWIRLSKAPEDDLWDVVATRMTRDALTWMNTKVHIVEELEVRPWPTRQVIVKAFKA